ncbi:helix-turn-helix domain-containing protein [Sutcliffiella horikoshii]|uniref:Helix-turn-helix domain-containing protein n=1 Tax=Sutcliffiella horikoshii TaxID=79883 RepID=A0A5D4T3S8_9BACI|nr:helix-turn-helix domain-containing protein [Sutcliffiella horikoshii]TYS70357.1 helix-turn-helix domain-containing protein [Sutcliffiella horikoshii]
MYTITHHLLEEGEELIAPPSIIYVAANSAAVKNINLSDIQQLSKGKAYWLKNGSIVSPANKYLKIYIIELKDMKQENIYFTVTEPSKICPILDELIILQKSKSFLDRCNFQAKLWNLIGSMAEVQPLDDIEQTITYIYKNSHKHFTVQDLAAKARMTPVSFARAFKKKTGIPPKEFVLDTKIKKAKELIVQNKGINIKDVALQIGIQDEFYFSRLFKKREGLSPTIYIKKIQDRVAVVSQLFLQDHLLSLGIQPVAAPVYPSIYPKTNGIPSYLEKPLEGTLLLNAEKTINSKDIMTVDPDCIIKTSLHHGEQQTLTWMKNKDVHLIDFQKSWDDYLDQIAQFFGREEAGATIKKEMRLIEKRAKEMLKGVAKSGEWAVVWVRSEEIRLYGASNHACMDLLYKTLEFTPHQGLPKSGYITITVNDLLELNPDKILFLWSTKAAVDKVAKDPVWDKLRAVENKEIYIPSSHEWDPWGPLGRKHMIEGLISYFNLDKKLLYM